MKNEASTTASNNVTKVDREPGYGTVHANLEDEEETLPGGWRETLRMALDRARRARKPRESHRRELGQDKTKALVLLAAMVLVLLLLFFGLFSSPNKPAHPPAENPHKQPNLGQKITPGQETTDASRTVTPMLNADVRGNEPNVQGLLTPEDIDRTSRMAHSTKPSPATRVGSEPQDYALGKVDFSDPLAAKGTSASPISPSAPSYSAVETDQRKPSLVFVRSIQASPAVKALLSEPEEDTVALPAGTRLLARLQAPVSSSVASPAVAVIEYNYERDGQIVMPAGAKVLGRLAQASPSGDVALQFTEVEMPDGTSEKLDASAMDLNFKPIRGYVSGKKTGTKFLLRSLTGLGTAASYLVGPQASNSAGLISTNVLLRERLADNVASAGQERLNGLAFNQNLVVTVPGNTRFYIVLLKPSSEPGNGVSNANLRSASATRALPTLEELRQLMQLQREINELYSQNNGQSSTQPSAQP